MFLPLKLFGVRPLSLLSLILSSIKEEGSAGILVRLFPSKFSLLNLVRFYNKPRIQFTALQLRPLTQVKHILTLQAGTCYTERVGIPVVTYRNHTLHVQNKFTFQSTAMFQSVGQHRHACLTGGKVIVAAYRIISNGDGEGLGARWAFHGSEK